ncbi:hypothetical protein AAG747_21600 [Rapidithrix thailandica]|uniref:Transporter n=1 Tax=Rapidithrix thailandica TaxID=413964 RepID=A0AAW9SDC6_9BACT
MMKNLYILLSLLISVPSISWAGGGWPQKKGKLYLKLGQYSILAKHYYSPAGHVLDITTTGYHATSLYGEWGITDKFTAIAYFPFFVRSTLNKVERPDGQLVQKGDELNSIGDADITLKYGILKAGPYVGALSLTLGVPLGEPSGGRTELLQSGDGEFNQMLTFELSRSFGKGHQYVSLLLGFNNRTENFSDEFRYGAEFGAKVKRFWLIARLYGIESFENGNEAIIANNGIFSNNLEYLSLSPEIAYEWSEQMGVSVGAGFALQGKRILADPSFSMGIYLKI